jgi:hypothetical protein
MYVCIAAGTQVLQLCGSLLMDVVAKASMERMQTALFNHLLMQVRVLCALRAPVGCGSQCALLRPCRRCSASPRVCGRPRAPCVPMAHIQRTLYTDQ